MKRILHPGVNCMGIYDVRKTGLLIDGRDFYRVFYEAAERAERYILLAGWQFDSDVALLRGKDVKQGDEVRFLPFLNRLCEKNPNLHIYILAWDFSELFLVNREWFQDLIFNWTTNERIHFRFDDRHAVGASHHEKLAVMDGVTAFVGGMDICEERWDDRDHLQENPKRKNTKGKPYEPYHDIQSIHIGPVAEEVAGLFKARWINSGGEMPELPPPPESNPEERVPTIRINAEHVAISRTRAKTLVPLQDSVREIRSLFVDALGAAEKLVYVENQYFSSQAVYGALADRMRDQSRPKLQIIIILPRKPHTWLEEISLGLGQVKMLEVLRDLARKEGHSLGIYYTLSEPPEKDVPVYIHAKVLIVDDRFMTVGSANTTNRSMGLDTELNVSWEASEEENDDLILSISDARASLLQEHIGTRGDEDLELQNIEGLIGRLDLIADSEKYRLRRHTASTIISEKILPKGLKPEDLKIDPGEPIVEEDIFELISNDKTGFFSQGIVALNDWLIKRKPGVVSSVFRFLWGHWRLFFLAVLIAITVWMILRWLD